MNFDLINKIFDELDQKTEELTKQISKDYGIGEFYLGTFDAKKKIFKLMMDDPKYKPGDRVKLIGDYFREEKGSEGIIVKVETKDDGRDRSEIASRYWYEVFMDTFKIESATDDELEQVQPPRSEALDFRPRIVTLNGW